MRPAVAGAFVCLLSLSLSQHKASFPFFTVCFFLFFFSPYKENPSLSFPAAMVRWWCAAPACRAVQPHEGWTRREGVLENDDRLLFPPPPSLVARRRRLPIRWQSNSGRRSPPPLSLFRPYHLSPSQNSAGSPRPGDSGGRPLFQARAGRRRRHR